MQGAAGFDLGHGDQSGPAFAQHGGATIDSAPKAAEHKPGGEANLVLPNFADISMMGVDGRTLLMSGLVVSGLGVVFAIAMYSQLKNLPVHKSMLEISELIYETCKTYLQTQGKFILLLEIFIGAIIVLYFGWVAKLSAPAASAPSSSARSSSASRHQTSSRRRSRSSRWATSSRAS